MIPNRDKLTNKEKIIAALGVVLVCALSIFFPMIVDWLSPFGIPKNVIDVSSIILVTLSVIWVFGRYTWIMSA